MGYRIGYSGPEVDNLLQKAYQVSVVNNGWNKLDSSNSNPVDLDSLVTQGNYLISFWSNGPVQLTTDGPINVSVTKDSSSGMIYQIIYNAGKIYIRKTTESSFSNTWAEEQNNTNLNIGTSTPQNPQDNYIWIDTSGEEPIIKIYKESVHAWIPASTSDMAKASVYDSQGVKQPIDEYLDQKIEEANLNDAEADYNAHLIEGEDSGSPIHVTTSEKTKWNAGISKDDASIIIDNLKNEMTRYANSEIETVIQEANTISTNVESISSNINNHIADSSIHLTTSDVENFDNKADNDHKHLNNNTVIVSASNIIGLIPIERIDPSVLERNVTVASYEEMLALTNDQIQNGDSVFINGITPSAWFVIDDTKLGTADAFIQYAAPAKDLTWDNIINKPSTLAEFNITDAYTADEITAMYNKILESINAVNNKVTEYSEAVTIKIPSDLNETIATNITSVNALNSNLDNLIKNMSLDIDFKNRLLSLVENNTIGDITIDMNKTVDISYNWTITDGGPGLSSNIIIPNGTSYYFDLNDNTSYTYTIDETYTAGMIDEHIDDTHNGCYEFSGWNVSEV